VIERVEGSGGAIALGVPAFDFFVWLLDNYARFDLLLTLQNRLPQFLFSPPSVFLCMCVGIVLLHLSHKAQMKRIIEGAERGLVDESGNRAIRQESAKWLHPLLFVLLFTLIAAPVLAVTITLLYDGNVPVAAVQRPPSFALDKTPPEANPSSSKVLAPRINQGPGSIAQVGGTGNQATVINQAPDYPSIDDAAFNRLVTQLQANVGTIAFGTRNGNSDALNYSSLLVRLFSASQWTIKSNENVNGPPDMDDEGAIPIPSGLHLFPSSGKGKLAMFVKKTLATDGIICVVDTNKRGVMHPQPGVDMAFFVGNPR
jgi:hypothetical protein